MLTIGFLLVVEAATLSRSGMLGLGVGALVLAVPYRRHLRRPELLVPIGGALAVLLAIVLSRRSFFTTVLKSRVQTSGGSENAHFQVYSFIPHVLHTRSAVRARPEHVLRLLRVRDRQVELGAALVLRRADRRDWARRRAALRRLRDLGLPPPRRGARARPPLAAVGDPLAARVRPLAWGCTAALAGTLASNAFYLTMQFYYFYAFIALSLAIPVVFAPREP